jgi:hypothetical protein
MTTADTIQALLARALIAALLRAEIASKEDTP